MKGRKSQNLVEVILIIPLLLILLLGIMEYAVFQRNVNTVQDIALESAVAASKYYVDESIIPNNPFTENAAVEAALDIVFDRIKVFNGPNLTFKYNDLGSAFGKRPFALYEFYTTQKIDYKGTQKPAATFTIDYREPMNEGVSTQLIFYHRLTLFGLKLQIPGGRTITLIPNNVQISSTQTRQYIHY